MSNNNKCKGWVNPIGLSYSPQINSLSGYYSPSGSTTLVSINGVNFYSYSKIIFGTYNPTVYFINSNIIQFYVPNTLNSGTFPLRVSNGTNESNSVNYTIDNASGFWLQNSNNSISNTNTNSVSVTSLSRGTPITVTNGPYATSLFAPYEVKNADNCNWIICNGDIGTSGTIFVKLQSDTSGREIMFKNISNSNNVTSTTNNISHLNGTISNIILQAGAGKWVTLVYDGYTSKWIIMQGN
jgi:hypothetical protein